MRAKTLKRCKRAVAVFLAFFVFLAAVLIFLLIASAAVDRDARVLPSYERIDLKEILDKDKSEWTDEEFETVSLQTGVLSKETLLEIENSKLFEYQSALFFEGEVRHEVIAPTTAHDYLYDVEEDHTFSAPLVPLEDGDVIVTSTCHTYGWRNGHAALVVNGGRILQSVTLGVDSEITSANGTNGTPFFRTASNFIVLRLKDADKETRKEIADSAAKHLCGVPYSLAVGIFFPKDQGLEPKATNCCHLVWQAYKNFGYDLDFDGGPVCTTRDIANAPDLEIVQIYGFDPLKGW